MSIELSKKERAREQRELWDSVTVMVQRLVVDSIDYACNYAKERSRLLGVKSEQVICGTCPFNLKNEHVKAFIKWVNNNRWMETNSMKCLLNVQCSLCRAFMNVNKPSCPCVYYRSKEKSVIDVARARIEVWRESNHDK